MAQMWRQGEQVELTSSNGWVFKGVVTEVRNTHGSVEYRLSGMPCPPPFFPSTPKATVEKLYPADAVHDCAWGGDD